MYMTTTIIIIITTNIGWQVDVNVRGRFSAPDAALIFDAQSGEALWRNAALRPVPDSMAAFVDFNAIFGRQQLHVGLVQRKEHRHWYVE
jgi:hypothetical protein